VKTKELIEILKRFDPKGVCEVRIWDADEDEYMPVTGAVCDSGAPEIDLFSDVEP